MLSLLLCHPKSQDKYSFNNNISENVSFCCNSGHGFHQFKWTTKIEFYVLWSGTTSHDRTRRRNANGRTRSSRAPRSVSPPAEGFCRLERTRSPVSEGTSFCAITFARTTVRIEQNTILTGLSVMTPSIEPGNPYQRARLSTVDLLVITNYISCFLYWKNIYFFTKQATLKRRSTVLIKHYNTYLKWLSLYRHWS